MGGWNGDGAPKQLRDKEGKIVNSPKQIANIMANFYKEKVLNIRKNQTYSGCPLKSVKRLMKNKFCQFSLRQVSRGEVDAAMRKMKNSTSFGYGGIPADLFKKTRPWTLGAITHIVNISIRLGKFLQLWKISKVIPFVEGRGEAGPQGVQTGEPA